MPILPGWPPIVPGYDLYDYYSPTERGGGLYYDFLPLRDDKLVLVLVEPSGTGTLAALLGARLGSEMCVLLASGASPSNALNHVNKTFSSRAKSEAGAFASAVVAILNVEMHELTLANAGHMPPLLRHADASVTDIRANQPGISLGVYPDACYDELQIEIGHRQMLVITSSGFTDASNASGRFDGVDRIRAAMQISSTSATEFGQAMVEDVNGFLSGHGQPYDICLMCVLRNSRDDGG